MTSTNINIGFMDSKNCSRVLKPPGGGHSDIFGINGDELQAPSKKNNQPSSTIMSCFQEEKIITTDLKKIENDVIKIDENTEPPKKIQEEKGITETDKPVAGAPRPRVPPGGFSSGFW